MLIALQKFHGERPRIDARLIGHSEAQVARNVKLWGGTIKSWFIWLLEILTGTTGTISIYRYTDSDYWLHWTTDVDVVRSPIADINTRIYFTGDGVPKMTDVKSAIGQRLSSGSNSSGSAELNVDRVRGFLVGDSVRITHDSGTQDVVLTGITDTLAFQRLTFSASTLDDDVAPGLAVTSLETDYPRDAYPLGVPAPTAAPGIGSSPVASGLVTGATSEIDSVTEEDTTTDVDLPALTSVTGEAIQLTAKVKLVADIQSVQQRHITIQIDRTDGGLVEQFRESFLVQIQGRVRDNSQSPAEYTDRTFTFEEEISVTVHPEFGSSPVYRLYLFDQIIPSPDNTVITKTKTLTARYLDSVGLTVTSVVGLLPIVGDFIKVKSVTGDVTLLPINNPRLEVTDVTGFVVSVISEAFGTYTSGGTWELVHDAEDLEARSYVYTFVAVVEGKEMEGPPSPPSVIINVGEGDSILLDSIEDPWNLANKGYYTVVRVYRTATGNDADASFLFVGETATGNPGFVDDVRGTALGEEIVSTLWFPPPSDLSGLFELPNGVFAGFRENELHLSEPYQPHAWPATYIQATQDNIVGAKSFGASLILGTVGIPYIMIGTAPLEMSMERIEAIHPCLAKRGMVDMGYAILYPGTTGLVMVSSGTVEVVTYDLWTVDEWNALVPTSFVAARYDDRYFCLYNDGSEQAAFIIDPREADSSLTFLDLVATEVWSDPETKELYVVNNDTAGAEQIAKWDGDITGIPLSFRWRSKEFIVPVPKQLSVVKVDAELYPQDDPIRVNIYMDGKIFDSVLILDEQPVRLSDKKGLGRKWELEIIGTTEIEALYAASSMRRLVQYL